METVHAQVEENVEWLDVQKSMTGCCIVNGKIVCWMSPAEGVELCFLTCFWAGDVQCL